MIQRKLVVGKMRDETAGAVVTEFVRIKPNIYSFLVEDSSKHKKAKNGNKNVVAIVSHNE